MLTKDELRSYCLSLPGAFEDFPFDAVTATYKVKGKLFLLLSLDAEPLSINVKCDPKEAEMLREMYPAIQPGYHMNKKHWNTITIDGSLPDDEIRAMIADSYALVVKGLKKAEREELQKLAAQSASSGDAASSTDET